MLSKFNREPLISSSPLLPIDCAQEKPPSPSAALLPLSASCLWRANFNCASPCSYRARETKNARAESPHELPAGGWGRRWGWAHRSPGPGHSNLYGVCNQVKESIREREASGRAERTERPLPVGKLLSFESVGFTRIAGPLSPAGPSTAGCATFPLLPILSRARNYLLMLTNWLLTESSWLASLSYDFIATFRRFYFGQITVNIWYSIKIFLHNLL